MPRGGFGGEGGLERRDKAALGEAMKGLHFPPSDGVLGEVLIPEAVQADHEYATLCGLRCFGKERSGYYD
ncbi:hypothetical protein F183_A36630 [Bryobacterales bacterium F-183]|nr:hypothetical protein F183_A36630 [Bryobacterales bacterium F-183]